MDSAVHMFVACVPALVLGYMMPSIFSAFGLSIEGPPNRQYKILSAIIYPSFVLAAVWMMWYSISEFTLLKFFTALLLVTGLAMVVTWLRREIAPIVRAKLRSLLKRLDEWLYIHSP